MNVLLIYVIYDVNTVIKICRKIILKMLRTC